MVAPFDPEYITAHVSMNRVRLTDLSDIAIDEEVKHKMGYELLSLAALVRLNRANAYELRLSASLNTAQFQVVYIHCLTSNIHCPDCERP